MNDITSYMLEQTKKILSIDSPTGFTAHAAEYVLGAYKKLGYDAKLTNKGGIFVCVNDGPDQADDPADAPILLEAHMDTLGGMVCSINEKGRLMLSALGGMNPNNAPQIGPDFFAAPILALRACPTLCSISSISKYVIYKNGNSFILSNAVSLITSINIYLSPLISRHIIQDCKHNAFANHLHF